jgi:hypothetical protein
MWSISQLKQSILACTEVLAQRILPKQNNRLLFASYALQSKIFDIRIALAFLWRALLDMSSVLVEHPEEKDISEDGIVGGFMFHCNFGANIMRLAMYTELSCV